MQVRRPRPTAPKAKPATARFTGAERDALADGAVYIGSGDHKDSPNFTGTFRPRKGAMTVDQAEEQGIEDPDCTICPRGWAARQDAATALLRQAICNGFFVTGTDGPLRTPERVWAQDPTRPEIVYEARRLSAPENGYKAYPLTRSQARRCPFRFP
jgi:hypothetical protein